MQFGNTRSDFSNYPLAWLSGAFAFGIFAENFLPFGWQAYFLATGFLFISAAIFRKENFAVWFILAAFVAVGAILIQIEEKKIAPNRLKKLYEEKVFHSGENIEIIGKLRGRPETAVGGVFILLETESAIYRGEERNVSGYIRIFAPVQNEEDSAAYEKFSLRHGTKIRVVCQLRREERFQNPGVVSTLKFLNQKDIDATATIKEPTQITKLSDSESFAATVLIFDRRQNLIDEIRKHFSTQTAGVLIASLLGNKYFLDKETSQTFREGGTFHILVISGLQITFIGGLTIFLLRFLTKNRIVQFAAATSFLWIYSIAVGADAPVTRAALMFTILIFGQVIFRQTNMLNSLGAAALILLVRQPSDLFDQSFQLTFMCVAAIVARSLPLLEKLRAIGEWSPSAETPTPPNCGRFLRAFCEAIYWSEQNWKFVRSQNVWNCKLFKTPLAEKLERCKLQKFLRFVFETLTVSLIVQLWLIPFLIVYFHRLSLAGIFLNIFAGLISAIESLTAMAAILFAQINYALAAPFIFATEILNWSIIFATGFFIQFDWANWRIPHYTGAMRIVYVLYFVPIAFITYFLHSWRPFDLNSEVDKREKFRFVKPKFVFASYLILLTVIIFHPFSADSPDGRLHVEFLDVGQGDAAFLTMPTGETMLVDGGGKINFNNLYVVREGEKPEPFEPDTQSIGETVVSPFLWEKGLSKVDYILATHADADHIQGLADVAKNFRVRAAIFGRTPTDDADFFDVQKALEKRGVPVYVASRGDVFDFGDVKIEVLFPEDSDKISDNNHSVVLRIIYGERKFLLTGDIEKETENKLLNFPEMLRADVVKVAHHGSKTSSGKDFINATKAKVAVVSVGKNSPFGHPKIEVVERWKESETKVLTTGENGTISFSTDGKDLQMKTFLREVNYR